MEHNKYVQYRPSITFLHTDTYLYIHKLKKWLMVRTVHRIREFWLNTWGLYLLNMGPPPAVHYCLEMCGLWGNEDHEISEFQTYQYQMKTFP